MKRLLLALVALCIAALPASAAMQQVGGGMWWPAPYIGLSPGGSGPGLSSASLSNGNAGAQMAAMGYVRFAQSTGASKAIHSVEFLAGSITAASNSITIDIEGVSTSNAAPASPDGSVCNSSTATLSVALASLTASAWNAQASVGTFTGDCTVTEGQLIAVVFKWTSLTGTPTFNIQGVTDSNTGGHLPLTATSATGAAPFTAVAVLPNIVLNFADGSVGTLDGSWVTTGFTTVTGFGSGSSPNEFGNCWTQAFAGKVNGIWASIASANAATQGTLELTDNATPANVLASYVIDVHQFFNSTASFRPVTGAFAETQLTVGSTYCMGFRASAASVNLQTQYFSVNTNAHLGLYPGGSGMTYFTRAGSGWSGNVTTRRVQMGVRFSMLDDGTGGGGSSAKCIIGGDASDVLKEWLRPFDPMTLARAALPRPTAPMSRPAANDNRVLASLACAG